jgi:putative heme-binding domain-containing protein
MATRLWPDVRFASSSEKTRRISQVTDVLRSGAGNPAAGKKIYMNNCGACHRLFAEGGSLGPDLTGYDRSNISEMLTNIVDPGAYVREGYVTYRITTSDGRVLTGNVSGREGTTVKISLLSGESLSLPESEIREMEAQPSMMPDNLLDNLDEDQIRDLFAFLQSKTP